MLSDSCPFERHLSYFVSFYLAMFNGVDPTDTGAIEWLKARMAQVPVP